MDPRVDIYKRAFSHQTGAGFDFPVYQGRSQFDQGFNFLCFKVVPNMEMISEI